MTHYKGRSTIKEIMDLPNRIFHGLYVLTIRKLSTDEGVQEEVAQEIEEKIEEGGMSIG